MNIKRVLILTINISLLSALNLRCSQGESNPRSDSPEIKTEASDFSAQLPLEQLKIENCLSLEKLQNYFSDTRFQFDSRQTTVKTEIENEDSRFLKANFGINEVSLNNLPKINNIRQNDCNSLQIQNSYGMWSEYSITEASEQSLAIEYVKSAPDDLSEAMADTIKKEPKIRSLRVEIMTPLSLKYTYESETISLFCNPNKIIPYQKSLFIRWRDPQGKLAQTEAIDRRYLQKIIELIETSASSAEELENLPTPESVNSLVPLQTPDVLVSSNSEESSFETLLISYEQIKDLQARLEDVSVGDECNLE